MVEEDPQPVADRFRQDLARLGGREVLSYVHGEVPQVECRQRLWIALPGQHDGDGPWESNPTPKTGAPDTRFAAEGVHQDPLTVTDQLCTIGIAISTIMHRSHESSIPRQHMV